MFVTSFQKKNLYGVILSLILGFSTLLYPFFISASEEGIFNDDFETYNLGDLVGQGDWSGDGDTFWKVADTRPHKGVKSAYIDSYSDQTKRVWKIGEEKSTGIQSAWVNFSEVKGGNPIFSPVFELLGWDHVSDVWRWLNSYGIKFNSSTSKWEFGYYDLNNQWVVLDPDVSQDEWHSIEAEFDEPNWQYRLRLDTLEGGDWSDWIPFHFDYYKDYIDSVGAFRMESRGQEVWVDTIDGEVVPICELGHCSICTYQEQCESVGCFWWFEEEWYGKLYPWEGCSEPPSGGGWEEECGAFNKCQYCLTQELCEAQWNCEWVNKYDLGEKCYNKMPAYPPEQEEWQTCEFDDCEELGLPEKWICFLGNQMKGIFCPSQETLVSLQDTLNSFKYKFPFNYLSSTTYFFNSIKNDLNDEKEIDFKIWGKPATMNFDFLDMVVKVGGVEETLGNLIKDFSTLLIVIPFSVYMVAFIKRFWR